MRSTSRRSTLILATAPIACLGLISGCSTYTASGSDWRSAPPPQIRAGIGDSLGNALFLRHVQLAKSAQFQTSPQFASQSQQITPE